MFKHTIVITGITLLTMLGAVAGTVTTPTVNVTVTNTSGNALIQQFDPSLGTLTGITLNFGPATISDDISISDFEEGGTINITYNLGHEVTFDLPVGSPYVTEDFQALNCSGSGAEFSNCNNFRIAFHSSSRRHKFRPLRRSTSTVHRIGQCSRLPYAPSLVENLVTSTPTNSSRSDPWGHEPVADHYGIDHIYIRCGRCCSGTGLYRYDRHRTRRSDVAGPEASFRRSRTRLEPVQPRGRILSSLAVSGDLFQEVVQERSHMDLILKFGRTHRFALSAY